MSAIANPPIDPKWSDEELRYLLTHSADILWRIDANFKFTHVNSIDEKLWGYPREELIGKSLSEVLTPESMRYVGEMNRMRLAAEAAGEKTGTVWVEAVVVAKDGTRSWAEVTSTPVRGQGGAIIGYNGVTRDITPRKMAEIKLAEESRKLAKKVGEQAETLTRLNAVVEELAASRRELAASEDRYRVIVDQNQVGIAVHRLGRFVYVNPAAMAMVGAKDASELIGTPMMDRVHPDFRAAVAERAKKALETGVPAPPVAEKFLRLDGSSFDARISSNRIDYGGEPANLVIFEDITEKVRAEEAMAEKTEELDNFFKLALDLLCIADMEGRFTRLNPTWETTLGWPVSELEGKRYIEFVHPDDVAATNEASARLAAGESVTSFVNRYRCRDGSYRYIEWRTAPYKGRHIYAAARDVTARREMEGRVAQSEAQLRSLVAASPMGIHQYRLEDDGRLIFTGANPAADRILGIDNSRHVGKTIEEAFPALVATPVPTLYRRAAATGEPWQDEQVVYDEGTIHGAYQVFAFRTSPGQMAAMFLDVTSRKKAEEEKRKLEEELLQAQKMEAIGRLAGGVAHDFNNLLTAIIGYCDLAAMRGQGEKEQPEMAAIRVAADKAASLTHQLLAFSRKQILQPKVINPADVVTDAQKMLGRLLGEDVRLTVSLAGDTGFILADPGQITQVIMNLALNARDAMPEGGRLTIETRNVAGVPDPSPVSSCPTPGPHVLVSVSDTGVGIDEAAMPHIFEPFYTTKEVGKGTGLGLATVHGIVTQSGGCVGVRSEPGMGSRFDIYLPRVDPPKTGERADPPSGRPRGGAETILLAEDSPEVRKLAVATLAALGYRVLAAESGEEALRLAAEHRGAINLLLTDVVMPGMSGKALAGELARTRPETAVVFMSGYTEDAIVHHGVLEAGITFIQKPFSPRALADLVRKTLDGA